jgi:hypothetical protein
MAVVHIPRIRGSFGGVVIPRALFDGARYGLGVFCGEGHPDPSSVERDVRRITKGHGVAFAGRLDLPGGTLLGVEMPSDPARLFLQLGLPAGEVRAEVNAVNLRDPAETDVLGRWRSFQQIQHRARGEVGADQQVPFRMAAEEVGTNGRGAIVVETAFGRAFADGGEQHAEWQMASDGSRKGRGGRASLFLRAYDMGDWSFLARGLVAQLHRWPDQRIGTRDLERLMQVAHTPGGPTVAMDELRELIEGEVALVRGRGAVAGRGFAEAVSVGFPPHDPRDRKAPRVVMAQFSTPPAVAEIAAEYLKPAGRTVLEPTIGNGVLAAPAHAAAGLVVGIEKDTARHARAVEALPEARIVLGDATDPASFPASPLDGEGRFDAVLANPPYGRPEERPEKVRLRAFGIELPASRLETQIAASAIDRLREGGNAVLVMPAQMMRPSELTEEGRRFHTMLSAVFREVRSVALDASLYRNMGANFPVIVHFCEDRRPVGRGLAVGEAARHVPDRIEVVGTFAAFFERASRIIQESRIRPLEMHEVEARRAAFAAALLGATAAEVEPEEEASAEPVAPGPTVGGRTDGPRPSRGAGWDHERDEGEVERPIAPVAAGAALDAPARDRPREWFVDDFSPDPFTVPYTPRSQKGVTLAVIERTMADETYSALRRVEDATGLTVDEYVAARMGIPFEEFMSERVLFYPEQVDSLALTFHRRETGRATIVGDQMGVGKGIQLAAHAYSALMVEARPVLFLTNRANLFSDLCVRDWRNASGRRFIDMVENGEVRPFIFNADGALREDEKVVFATPPDQRREAQSEGRIRGANFVMMTYSQVQTAAGAWRHAALKAWVRDHVEDGRRPVMLLDEAHKAAGEESRTGMVIQDLLSFAEGVGVEIVYSSATSLKSGRNLPVYRPALPDTGLSTDELLVAIEKMPLAMQEILASEMARDGALIERKMSDAGVNRELVVLADIDGEKMDRTRALTDRVSGLLRELAEMGPVIARAARQQFVGQLGGALMAGSADKVRVETTSVASQLDSFSRYLMGAVKGQFVGELLEDAMTRGSKPAVVLEYTADSVSEWVIGGELTSASEADGAAVRGHPHIGDVLKRFAEKALVFKGHDGFGNISELRVEGFDGWLRGYGEAVDGAEVEELRVNVFDRVREAARSMGMTFEDITGRRFEFREVEGGGVRAFLRDRPTTADAVARYNRGQTDIIGLNSGSATGVSAQASLAHGHDVRRREMIKLAFQREITDERQVEGRVHRAGQLVPPRYTIPVTGFAPDDRIANLFNRANRSLTSATSATRENRTNAEHAVDILNPIGERAAQAVLRRNPVIADMLGIDAIKGTDVARKLLGRSVMLPLAEQSAILSEVDAEFRVVADKMTAEGSNPLRLQFYEWGAEVEAVEDLIAGDPGARGIAAQPLRLHQVTYREKVESLATRTVLGNVLEAARRRDGPFENMHAAWNYDRLFRHEEIDFDHHLLGGVTGRRAEGMRHLWPMPIPATAATAVMAVLRGDVRERERKLGRSINGEEFRAASEDLATRLLDPRRAPSGFRAYGEAVRAKLGEEGFKHSTVAVALRAMWSRTEQARRLDRILGLVEPGRLVAFDARSLTRATAGLWGAAYEKVDLKDGLIPALITSARYEADAPFAESKMSLSVFVPGARFTERVTLSSLHSAMEASGAGEEPPLRPFASFLASVARPEHATTAWQAATREALDGLMGAERVAGLQDQVAALRARHGKEALAEVVPGGREVAEAGGAMFAALAEAMPQEAVRRRRMTLEGNLFAAMSMVSSSLSAATSGEKVVYTDRDGTHRNAILLSNRATDKLVEAVRRKAAKRSVVHAGLKDVASVADYLRLADAVQFGLHYAERDGEAEVVAALDRLYPGAFEALGAGGSEGFAETMAAIRGRMPSAESTFPASVMAGGDIWRWGVEIAQKAAQQSERPRGYVPGCGGPASMTVRVAEDVNALGFRDVEVRMRVEPHGLAAAMGALERGQALALQVVRGQTTLALHKDHPALRAGDALLDGKLEQAVMGVRLRSGVLAGMFDVTRREEREAVARVLTETGGGKPELLVGGVMKQVQRGLDEEAVERLRGRRRAALEAEARPRRPAAEARFDGP